MKINLLKQIVLSFTVFLQLTSNAFAIETVRIVIVLDGPIKREILPLEQVKKEITDLTSGEFNVVFPEDKLRHGN